MELSRKMHHSKHSSQCYMQHQCTIFMEHVSGIETCLLQNVRFLVHRADHECYIVEVLKNFKEKIPIGPYVPLTKYYSDKYLKVSDTVKSRNSIECPNLHIDSFLKLS